MTIALLAPHELPVRATVLPSPDLGNTVNLNVKVQMDKAIKSNVYTYVRNSGQYHLKFDFSTLSVNKVAELDEFFRHWSGRTIRVSGMTRVYACKLLMNPFTYTSLGRGICGDFYTATIELFGDWING